MAYIMKQEELKLLETLVGKEITVSSSFSQQDEYGVASSGSAQWEGILKGIGYDRSTMEIYHLSLECKPPFGLTDISMDTRWELHVWDRTVGIYQKGVKLISIPTEPPYEI